MTKRELEELLLIANRAIDAAINEIERLKSEQQECPECAANETRRLEERERS